MRDLNLSPPRPPGRGHKPPGLARRALVALAVSALLPIWGALGPPRVRAAGAKVDIDVGITAGMADITNLAVSPGAATGTLILSWTEPDGKGLVLPTAYDIRVSTAGEIINNGQFDAALPLSSFTSTSPPTPGPGGGLASLTVTGLAPSLDYCFAIREHDSNSPEEIGAWIRNAHTGWNVGNCAYPTAPIASPANPTATAGLETTILSWNAPSPLPANLAYYGIYRSTQAASGFVNLATTTATGFTDEIAAGALPLPNTFYYYVVSVSTSGGQSAPTPTVSTSPYTLPPMEPLGLNVSTTATSVTLSWSPTTRFGDGTPFYNPAAPKPYELEGYVVIRSTELCSGQQVVLSTQTIGAASFTDVTNGDFYFYQIKSSNTLSVSTNTLVLSSLGDVHLFLDDCVSQMMLTQAQNNELSAARNGLGGDIQIARSFRPQDTGNGIVASAEFVPMLNGSTPLPDFTFSSPVSVILHYDTSNGQPLLQSVSTLGPGDLGLYWFNGEQFYKVYGQVDTYTQTVLIQSPNPGIYQIRSLERTQSGPVFDVSNVLNRVITPNGDGKNDDFIVIYDPGPNNVVPSGRIYDLKGHYIANMKVAGTGVPNTITWDGKATNGRVVSGGVYVYAIAGGGQNFTGTVIVAR